MYHLNEEQFICPELTFCASAAARTNKNMKRIKHLCMKPSELSNYFGCHSVVSQLNLDHGIGYTE
jgi:hypothetical protein